MVAVTHWLQLRRAPDNQTIKFGSNKISIHIYQSRHALYTPKIVKYLLIYIYNTCRRRVVEINGVCLRQAGPNLTRHLKLIASK